MRLHAFCKKMSPSAFTLIELLIVVAIIAILAAIAVPNFLEAQTRAKVSRAKADQRSIATAIESYRVDNTSYPPAGISQDKTIRATFTVIAGVTKPVPSAPVNPRIQRLAWITTPVAYMTSISNDPFTPGPQDTNPLDRQFPVFTYWDEPTFDYRKNGSNSAIFFRDMPSEIGSRNQYVLFSYGPDKMFEAARVISPAPPLAIYDPTNGTVSVGDVIRAGGSGVK